MLAADYLINLLQWHSYLLPNLVVDYNFLLFGQPGKLEAGQAVATAQVVFAEAGIPVAEHKTEGPATSVTFLGILVDTVQFQLR